MALATLTYNASTGSDTAASGSNAPTTAHTDVSLSATVSGTAGTTTMTFSATIDLTGVANDGTDVIWCAGTSGQRHLFRITAFTGGVSTCTGLTVAETIGASGLSASSWAIGGKRQTLQNDTSWPDLRDYDSWTIELDDGTYTATVVWPNVAYLTATNGPLTIQASAAATGRPKITTAGSHVLEFWGSGSKYLKGIELETTDTSATNYHLLYTASTCCLFVDDVVFDLGTSASLAYHDANPGNTTVFRNCWISGGTSPYAIYLQYADSGHMFIGNVFKGCGNGGNDAAISLGNSGERGITILNNLFYDCYKAIYGSVDSGSQLNIVGNTIADSTSHGIDLPTVGLLGSGTHIINNVIAYNGGYGINLGANAAAGSTVIIDYNAYRSNTSGEVNNGVQLANEVTLSADPFTNRAGDDYTLNDTAGGGAACKDAGFPGATLPDGT